ncbi:hypothetical protein [Pseudoalteromonas sp. GB56]
MAINNGKPHHDEAPDKLAHEFAQRCADLFHVEPEQLTKALANSSSNPQLGQLVSQLSQQLSVALIAAQLASNQDQSQQGAQV